MINEIDYEHLDVIGHLLKQYSSQIKDETQSLPILKDQFARGQKDGSLMILANTSSDGAVRGFLVFNLKSNRISVIFGEGMFENEKALLDEVFTRFKGKVSSLVFESGYPTPWISDDLSEYAIEKGFEKHERGYMRLEPISIDSQAAREFSTDLQFINFSKTIISEVSDLVFRSVDRTTDQKLFQSIYGSAASTERFLHQLHSGQFGLHKDSYSWTLKENSKFIGACFFIIRDETGFLVHIVIDPGKRGRGFGRKLLLHSIQNLLVINENIKRIELAVTWANPARHLYEALGFKLVNKSTTFVWNGEI